MGFSILDVGYFFAKEDVVCLEVVDDSYHRIRIRLTRFFYVLDSFSIVKFQRLRNYTQLKFFNSSTV